MFNIFVVMLGWKINSINCHHHLSLWYSTSLIYIQEDQCTERKIEKHYDRWTDWALWYYNTSTYTCSRAQLYHGMIIGKDDDDNDNDDDIDMV